MIYTNKNINLISLIITLIIFLILNIYYFQIQEKFIKDIFLKIKEIYTKSEQTVLNEKEEIKKLAKKAFLAIDGNGLSRVDFFVEKDTNKIYINEINTMPGFTKISMYPKLFEFYGYKYSELLDKIIEISL